MISTIPQTCMSDSFLSLPKPLPSQEEAKIEIRREQYEKVFRNFVNENCSEAGTQRSNLLKQQKNGLKKLQKRKMVCALWIKMSNMGTRSVSLVYSTHVQFLPRISLSRITRRGKKEHSLPPDQLSVGPLAWVSA